MAARLGEHSRCIGRGNPGITTILGQPALPLEEAVKTALASIGCVALACGAGKVASERPRELAWISLDGRGVAMTILVGRPLYRPLRLTGLPNEVAQRILPVAGVAAGALWLAWTTLVRRWRRRPPASAAAEILAAGLAGAYLLLPLVHPIVFTDRYFYITDSADFFYRPWRRQVTAWLLACALATGVSLVRARVTRRMIQSDQVPRRLRFDQRLSIG